VTVIKSPRDFTQVLVNWPSKICGEKEDQFSCASSSKHILYVSRNLRSENQNPSMIIILITDNSLHT